MDVLRASILLTLLMVRPVATANSTQTSTGPSTTSKTIDSTISTDVLISVSSLAGFSSSVIVIFLVVSCLKRMRRQPRQDHVVYLERPQPSNMPQLSTQDESMTPEPHPRHHPLAQFYPQLSLSPDPSQPPMSPMDRFQERHQCRCHMLPASYEDIGRSHLWRGYHYSREDMPPVGLTSTMNSACAKQLKASRRLSRSVPDLSLPRKQPHPYFPRMPELPDETTPISPPGGSSKRFQTLARERDPRSERRRLADDVTTNMGGQGTYKKKRFRYSHERETNISQWVATRSSNISGTTVAERASSKTSGADDQDVDYVAMSSTQSLSQSPSQKKADTVQARVGPQRTPDGRTSSHIYQNLPCLSSKTH